MNSIQKEIILYKDEIKNAVEMGVKSIDFLRNDLGKNQFEIQQSLKEWEFAFKNAFNWLEVENKFQNSEHINSSNITTFKSESEVDNKEIDSVPVNIENAEIIIEILTQHAFGKFYC